MELNQLTITTASEGIRKNKFSVTELVSACMEEIKKRDPELHAYLSVFEDAKEEAAKADEMLTASGENLPPLFGIPLALKDNILLSGKPSTAGSKILENYVASYDATVVRKLKNHGAIFLGKTNMDEFAMGSSTENSAFGPSKNPHDTARVPGGSSGGSAVAVSAHLALGAFGSDTGGSIRQPASLCGVVGFKPTYGAVSRHGLIAMASSLDQIGPFAKTVTDAEILFNAVKGKDPLDSTSVDPNYQLPITSNQWRGIRIGVPKEYFISGLDPRIESSIKSFLKKASSEGAIIKEISLPHSSYALATYYIIVPSEVSANLARFDGIRYGMQEKGDSLFETYARSRARGFGAETKRRIMLGTYVLSAGYYDAYYLKAQKVRALIKEDFRKAFAEVDVIAGPTTPAPAFLLGEKSEDPLAMYLADIYTVAVNLAGIPGISVPAGTVDENDKKLPIGLQLIGGWFEEPKLFAIAKLAEKLLGAGL